VAGHEHRQHAPELHRVDEDRGVAVLAKQRLVEDAGARDRDDHADEEREVARAGAVGGPAGAELARLEDHHQADDQQRHGHRRFYEVGGDARARRAPG